MTGASDRGWTSAGVALVEQAVHAHGGHQAWLASTSIRLSFVSGSGPLLTLKGFGRTWPAPREYEIFPHTGTVLFHGYPDDQHVGRYVDGTVAVIRVSDGAVVSSSPHHRSTMTGMAKYRRWLTSDALYFFGYALCHYCSVPFTLLEARLVGVLIRGGAPAGVDVEFAANVHTHGRRQQFYFGPDGRITRHDYVAHVVGRWARGAHFWEDYVSLNGLLVPLRRRVVVRLGHLATPLPVLDIRLSVPPSSQSSGSLPAPRYPVEQDRS